MQPDCYHSEILRTIRFEIVTLTQFQIRQRSRIFSLPSVSSVQLKDYALLAEELLGIPEAGRIS